MNHDLAASLPSPLWVLGTDTDVGKTWVAARIAEAWMKEGPVVYRKPFQCGVAEDDDPDSDLSALRGRGARAESFASFLAPLSPLAAAEAEGRRLDLDAALAWCRHPSEGRLLLEGVGGLLVPLCEDRHFLAWASELQIPCVLVARGGLGTLNHTLLSCEALMLRGWRIEAVLLNPGLDRSFEAAEGNAGILRRFLPLRVEVVRGDGGRPGLIPGRG
ncbi:MAG: dethiobiotin synthase [Holophagaceae bacterium]|nr:dethiobiotin synthase [Holophagaceae bacterium]